MATCLQGMALQDAELKSILAVAKDWALANGMVFKPNGGQNGDLQATCVPFTLFPSVVPLQILEQAQQCQKDFNTLMYHVAQDCTFLEQSLRSVMKVDAFVRGLWDIYTKVREEGITQPVSLDLFRNDFMMNMVTDSQVKKGHVPPAGCLKLKQIEFNTISASFAGLIGATSQLHKYVLDLAGKSYTSKQMPDNNPAHGMAVGLVKAWELYAIPSAVILFLVSNVETNIIDQRCLEFKVHDLNPAIRIIRRTMLEVDCRAELTKDKALLIDNMEVALVYFRTGYGDENYPTDKEWKARLLIERSRAIKCPTIQSQLSGFKKVQQELARPGAVERFISDPASLDRIKSTFAGLYPLDSGPEGDESVRLAVASPNQFVLKPQREGGGHNIYGKEIKELLDKIGSSSEREAYILMERIFPLTERNFLIKAGVPFTLSDVVSELGIYGVYIGNGGKELLNTQCGHMMRTKLLGVDEGGIVAGFAALDTPFVADA